MITKETLGLVLGKEVTQIMGTHLDGQLYYEFESNKYPLNLDTLGRLCKEWCFKQGYSQYIKIRKDLMNLYEEDHFFVVQFGIGSDKNAIQFTGKTELEAIIKATQWVAKEKD